MTLLDAAPPLPGNARPRLATAGEFKQGMRKLAAGVNVVTVFEEGYAQGLTATAVCSLSAEPPHLLVCVNSSASAHGAIHRAGAFGLNVLAREQEEIARRFAGMDGGERTRRFEVGRWTNLSTGTPLLEDALAAFDCLVVREISAATHTIFIGRVLGVLTSDSGTPLVFHDSRFTGAGEAAAG
ncbi:MAG TPA: flavin reductase family protein [Xanthobacteraceae bacterium]|nr:flavin reductase family protein [Xanthobacteraceae bacterium]